MLNGRFTRSPFLSSVTPEPTCAGGVSVEQRMLTVVARTSSTMPWFSCPKHRPGSAAVRPWRGASVSEKWGSLEHGAHLVHVQVRAADAAGGDLQRGSACCRSQTRVRAARTLTMTSELPAQGMQVSNRHISDRIRARTHAGSLALAHPQSERRADPCTRRRGAWP